MASAAPPSEFFSGINFNLSFYTAGDSSVTLNYVNANFLKCTGYAYSRAISTTFNNIVYFNGGFQTTNITATGTVTANLFSGSGASLTNINASNVTDGTLSVAYGGTGVSSIGNNRILFGSGGSNPIRTLPDLTFNGDSLTCYGEFNTFRGLRWGSQFSRLNRVLALNQFAPGTAIGDIVLISDAKLHLIGGSDETTPPGLTINALNNIGIGTTNPNTAYKLDVNGAVKATSFVGDGNGLTNLNLSAAGNITTTRIDIVNANTGPIDLLSMRYDNSNGLRFQQRYIFLTNELRYDIIQKYAGVDKTALTFHNGYIGINNSLPATTLDLLSPNMPLAQMRNSDLTQGIAFSFDSIDKIGTNSNSDLYFRTKGTGTFFFKTGSTDRFTIAGGGNIGIGTTNPSSKLDVNGNISASGTITASGNITTSNTLTATGAVFNGGVLCYSNLYVNNQMTWSTRYRPDDNFACNKINLWGTGGNYGFGIDGGTLDYFTGSTHRWWSDSGGTNYGNQRMNLTNGALSVYGSIYAQTTIQASGAFYFPNNTWNNSNEGKNRIYFASSSTTYIKAGNHAGRTIEFRSELDSAMAYIDNFSFYCYGPINLSDRRIKRDIEEINDDDALNKILLVQPTTYYYRDEARNKGNGKVYGFIAQQIKEVIPDAINITRDIIANIYKTCLVYNKREIYHSIPQDVAIDTEVQILDKEGGSGKRYKIKEIYEDHFVIDKDIDGDDCFVFGYCVDDLNGLDKSYIYTLNVCATQELHRRIEVQKVIIQSQEERIKELETKLEKLINYIYQ